MSSGEDRFVNKWLQYGGRVYRGLNREGSDEICREPVARVWTFSLSADECGAEPEHCRFPRHPEVCVLGSAEHYGLGLGLVGDVGFPAVRVELRSHCTQRAFTEQQRLF